MSRSRSRQFTRKLGTYSSLAAAAVGGLAGKAQAAPIIYDTQNNPIDVHTDYFDYGRNMAIIDPTVLTSSAGSALNTQGLPVVSAASAGLLGLIDNDGDFGNGLYDATPPADGLISTSSVYFRYQIFDDASGDDKEGTQFGTRVASGNGIYGFTDGPSEQPADNAGGSGGFTEGQLIGDGPEALLTTDTNPLASSLTGGIDVDIDGFGAGASFFGWTIVTGTKYLGFTIGDRNGFVKVNKGGTDRNRIFILGWGLESDPFVEIEATLDVEAPPPPVPEPSTLGLLCLGAAGLATYRVLRRRKISA